jgi:hypothetical protein
MYVLLPIASFLNMELPPGNHLYIHPTHSLIHSHKPKPPAKHHILLYGMGRDRISLQHRRKRVTESYHYRIMGFYIHSSSSLSLALASLLTVIFRLSCNWHPDMVKHPAWWTFGRVLRLSKHSPRRLRHHSTIYACLRFLRVNHQSALPFSVQYYLNPNTLIASLPLISAGRLLRRLLS